MAAEPQKQDDTAQTAKGGGRKKLLLLGLPAGHADLRGVDHDDEVPGIDMRRVLGLVLAAQA